jgi:hypothetical protein
MKSIEEILEILEAEEIRLVEAGEPQEFAFQLALTKLNDVEIKLWHSYNYQIRLANLKK